ncbi:MAG: aldehyde dehydrogenase family protein [Thermoleophilaceae bacterium]|nr:aldehyde dehydrogenase family protein [Thermoleophilaceae bacterium]
MSTVEERPAATTNGTTAAGPSTIPVENPATGKIVAHVPDMSADEVAALVARARAAQPGWEALGFAGRAHYMRAIKQWMVENRDRVIGAVMEETGKTREDATLADWVYCIDSLSFWAKHAPKYLADEKVRSHSPLLLGKKLLVRYEPVGVVGVIGPWNFPLTLCFGDAIPALMAGNSVVVKPSEVTPLSNLLIEEAWQEIGAPRDTFLVATGRGETGAALVDHSDMLMFTGSTATGKKIMARAAETLTPVSLELGGKDPMIVLRDADLERAANFAVQYSMLNAGQVCQSIERVYVEAPVYDEFVAKCVDKTRALRQGPPGAAGSVDVGAVIHPPQADIVERHVKDAVAKGAKVLVGGGRSDEAGHFFEPTVLVDVDHTMSAMTEETFGPTLPIMKVADEEEALRLANDSNYGLNSSVFTKDVEKGERIARRIQAGNACVNECMLNYVAQEVPFGGHKESGLGSRHGQGGIRKYTRSQTITIARFGPKRELHFYPFTRKRSERLEKGMALLHGKRGKR